MCRSIFRIVCAFSVHRSWNTKVEIDFYRPSSPNTGYCLRGSIFHDAQIALHGSFYTIRQSKLNLLKPTDNEACCSEPSVPNNSL
ncbi:hypothetical protein Golomagni_04422 [Golovinomyces magnicellulatus]|nr:hypothetical protein Golomagni_04422 [Golovinomyces magnicellulatus]